MIVLMLTPMGQHAVGAVLCIEANGTVSIEKATGFLCGAPTVSADKHEAADTVASADTPATSHCGTCIDVVLPGDSDEDCASFLMTRGPTAQVDLPVVAAALFSLLLPEVESLSVRQPLASEPNASSSLTPLRSIILLI